MSRRQLFVPRGGAEPSQPDQVLRSAGGRGGAAAQPPPLPPAREGVDYVKVETVEELARRLAKLSQWQEEAAESRAAAEADRLAHEEEFRARVATRMEELEQRTRELAEKLEQLEEQARAAEKAV